ncbi:MFS transporter [Aridibaculum aurantiacum]|uniref:MFS transporter n=1 Tax=Aridibaculum aurantiacum TaxID=2810307 RepID=UPI001F609286|nr:MFS transporter [Aridibaculum aurantiacum]
MMDIALPLPMRAYRIAISVYFFVAGLTFSTWASRIPAIQVKLQLSEAGLGAILFALPAGLLISLPISGWLVSKFSSRTILIIAAILYPMLLVPLGIASSVWLLAIGLFFFGASSNLLNIAMNTQAVSIERMYGRSIMASFHGLWSVGGFAGAIIGTLAVSGGFSPLIHFCIIWAVTAMLAVVSFKYALQEEPGAGSDAPIFAKPDKALWILGLIAFCCLVCEGAMADWSGVYFHKVVESPAAYTTLGYVAFTGTMATGRFVGDGLANRLGIKTLLTISGIITTVGLLIAVIFPHIISATLGFLLVGFGVSSVVPIVYGIAGKSTTMAPSVALAAVSTIGFMGFLIGPPLIGFIAEASNLRIAFTVIAVLALGTALLSRIIKK